LPHLSRFIIDALEEKISSGKYLTIEKPSLTVTQMIQFISGQSIYILRVPYFEFILKILAKFLYVLGAFGRIDMRLTPNRVTKLFSDTSYCELSDKDIDEVTYMINTKDKLSDILKSFKNT